MLFEAIEFAARAHSGQYRKGSRIPYIVHPINVAKIVLNAGGGESAAVAAVLHDTVEDTPVTLHDVHTRFGARVASIVEAMTEPDKQRSWEDRKRHTLVILGGAEGELLLVGCADKLDNIRSIQEDLARLGEKLWQVFKRPREAQRWYYQSLVQVLGPRMVTGAHKELFSSFEAVVRAVFDGPLSAG